MPWNLWRMYCIRCWEDKMEKMMLQTEVFLTESTESVTIILVLYALKIVHKNTV